MISNLPFFNPSGHVILWGARPGKQTAYAMSLVHIGLKAGGFVGAKFDLGALVGTPGAIEALQRAQVTARELLERHARGDWGSVHPEDEGRNDEALASGERLLSVYPLPTGETIWAITEWDRSVTTILLPKDY